LHVRIWNGVGGDGVELEACGSGVEIGGGYVEAVEDACKVVRGRSEGAISRHKDESEQNQNVLYLLRHKIPFYKNSLLWMRHWRRKEQNPF
jgi:hypothetical protein